MIDRKDRCTIFNAEHGFLDMIYVGLQRRRLRKKLGDERRSRGHVLIGRVLLARAQTCNKGLLTFGIFLPELVVVRTEATDVVFDNANAHYARDSVVRIGVPPAHSAACDYFRYNSWLDFVHNASMFVGFSNQTQGGSRLLYKYFSTRP
jgi:hypothetical protein